MPRGKRRKKATTAKKSAKKGVRQMKRRVGRPRKAVVAPLGRAAAVVSELGSYRSDLLAQRDVIEAQIVAVDNALSAMGTAPVPATRGPGRRPGRQPGRAGSLKSFIGQVMSGSGIMAVKDITDAVVKAGYKSRNQTLAKSVGIALTEMPNVTKVARGQFRLR